MPLFWLAKSDAFVNNSRIPTDKRCYGILKYFSAILAVLSLGSVDCVQVVDLAKSHRDASGT